MEKNEGKIWGQIEELEKRIFALKNFISNIESNLQTKEDKIEGKGLSTNDLSNDLKTNYDQAYSHQLIASGNPHGVTYSNIGGTKPTYTKSEVGLVNVDNTSDNNKNVLSATKLTTARTIAGVSFDGTANILIPFANLSSKPTTLSGYGITDSLNISNLLTYVYPVGSIYMSVVNVSPSSFIGGTWTNFAPGRVLLGMGSNGETNYTTVQSTGGSENSVAQHNHGNILHNSGGSPLSLNTGGSNCYHLNWYGTNGANDSKLTTQNAGITGGNRMPYITVYMWKRIE